jgi:uncharacterized protein involved in outer membrane biogenesis
MIPYGQALMRHRRALVISAAAFLIVFTLVGFFVVPLILKSVLTKQLTAALHRDVTIREVRFNPFALSATIRGLAVKEPKGPETFASLEELYVNLQASSLFRWAAVVKEARLTKPFVRVVRRPDESYNFSDLLPAQKAQPVPPTKPPRFSINNIQIIDGGADLSDELEQTSHTVRQVKVGIPFLSNIPSHVETFVQPGVSAEINQASYAIAGQTKPFHDSQETTLDVNISDLNLPKYLTYIPNHLLTFAMPSGRLDARLAVVFVRKRKGEQTLALKGDVALRQLAVDDKQGGPVVRIPHLNLVLASVEPLARTAHFSRITLESPELTVRRDKTGVTNLEALLPKPTPAQKPSEESAASPGEPIALDVDEISITGAKVLFSDLLPRLPFETTLAPIDVKVQMLSTRPDTNGSYAVTLATEANEQIALDGTMSLAPIAVNGKVNVQAVPLKKYAPYYADMVRFDIESGKLDVSSRYRYTQGEKEPDITASEAALSVSGLRLKRRDEKEDFLRVPAFSVEDTAIDVSRRQMTVGAVSTQKGFVSAKRLPGGEVDLQKLIALPQAGQPAVATTAAAAEKPWAVTVRRATVDQYTAKVEDRAAAEPITVTADKIRLSAEDISTAKNATGKMSLSLRLDQTATVDVSSTIRLDPMRADGKAQIVGVVLSRYAPYYKNLVGEFDVQDGILDVATGYRVAQAKEAMDIKLAGLSTALKSLRLKTRDTQQEFLNVPALSVKNTAVDVAQQDVVVGELVTEQGTVLVVRSRNGEINLARLLPRTTAAAATLVDAPGAAPSASAAAANPAARPWSVKADAVSVNQYRIHFTDEVPSEPVRLTVEDVALKAESLSTVENQPAGKLALALRLDKGTLSVEGPTTITPLTADLKVAVKDIDIRPFQPYVQDNVKVTITDGRVSTTGRLELSIKEPEGLQAKFTGESNVAKFGAIDKSSADELLKWESLALQELSVGYNPVSVSAKKVALADFFAHVVIEPDGRLNLQNITTNGHDMNPADQPKAASLPAPASTPPTKEAPQNIQIQEVTLQGGNLQFEDRSLKPNYSANMIAVGGRVSGLSSAETALADVELRGRMNNAAPLEITGKVNPLKRDLFADVQARFTGMDLSPASPYSGKYVGYVIEKGKLSFDVKYLIDRKKLSSENKVFIDQFTFGEKVDSPTATKLPVKLAVALLKDRNGQIRLDIPVNGSIDDPQFSVFGVILQVIGNLITKAVSSPFALLGAAFGGGEAMQYVEFDPGRATIPADGLKKVDALATALSEKPGLRLEIAGYVSPEADREGLKQYLMQRKVKAQKLQDLVKAGSAAVPVDDVTVTPEEYEKYLTLAYRAEPFPKPRNVIGLVKNLPVLEMEKLMLTHIEVGEQELRQLAARRANMVRDAILRSGKVEADRLFIVEPKGLTPEKKEKLKESRVEFKIA